MSVPVLLSALFAGLIAIGASVAIERFGGRLGGLLGSIPTTIIPASIGFWTSSANESIARDALFSVPPGMMVTALFLYCWRFLPPKLPDGSLAMRLTMMTIGALAIWFLTATALIFAMEASLFPIVGFGITCFILQVGFGVWASRFEL